MTRPAPKPSSEPASTSDERSDGLLAADPCGSILPARCRVLVVVVALTFFAGLDPRANAPEGPATQEPAIEEPDPEGPAIE